MQKPVEGISFNFVFVGFPSDIKRANVPASILEPFNEGDPVFATVSQSTGLTLSDAETSELLSHPLDVKFH